MDILEDIFCCIVNGLWVALCFPGYLAYRISASGVEKTQSRILFKVLKRNKNTAFGLKYNFDLIKTINDFQNRIPISTFEDYIAYLEEIKAGKKNVLTADRVLRLNPTSGSTSASKFIPFTRTLKKEFQRSIRPWVFNLYTRQKRLLLGKMYWSITPSTITVNSKVRTKIPIGFGDDSDYFSIWEKIILKSLLIVPQEVNQIQDIHTFRYVTLLFLISCKNLRFITIWNPMFLILILNNIPEWLPRLLSDLKNKSITPPGRITYQLKSKLERKLKVTSKRIEELEFIYERWKLDANIPIYRMIWPELGLISCWADSNAQLFVTQLRKLFPDVEIQPKGLIATEGFISFPFSSVNPEKEKNNFSNSNNLFSSGYLSVNSHFFEFMEIEQNNQYNCNNRLKLAHEVEVGKKYFVVLTTSGGLYRYNLQDIVEVTGFSRKIPVVRFLGKYDYVSDITGEKLNAHHVEKVLRSLFAKYKMYPVFYMLAPEKFENNTVAYTLFIKITDYRKEALISLAEDLDNCLSENFHYMYCRKLKQLDRLRLFVIDSEVSALEQYLFHKTNHNKEKLGNIKVSVLDKSVGWTKVFSGALIHATEIEAEMSQ